MAKKVADAKAALEDQEKMHQALLEQIGAHRKTVADAEAAMVKATAEVAELAAKYAAERTAPAGNGALAGAAGPVEPSPLGYVSINFAEEKWAEREMAFAQQLEQLKAMVASQGEGGAVVAEVAPSAASELGSVEDLEDDEKWNQVAKGSRRALLRKQREELASRLRSKLGGVASVRSPFLKR
jgi:hypothetical protein